ncbi:MAG: efflux RND transporter periplasmic adaptor subunit [Planctomycetota bacterium]
MRRIVFGGCILLVAVAGFLFAKSRFTSSPTREKYMTAKASKGPISLEVTSTGAINSVVTVQVGTQVSGTILDLCADFNTKVKAGQVIARLDPALFKATVEKEKANIASAEANILKLQAAVAEAKRSLDSADSLYKGQIAEAQSNLAVAKANVEKAKATKTQTKRALDRATQLVKDKTIAQSEKDDAQANWETAEAQLKAAEAQVEVAQASLDLTEVQSKNTKDNAQTNYDSAVAQLKTAEAQLEQAKAAHESARVNYEHTIITSPIDGIVVARAVDVGQTVAASLQSPTLFTIANDLTKMQVEATVDEADIGKIKVGQKATFTVDAFPDDVFAGAVSQVRLSPTTVQNVVTYTVIVSVNNPESKLMPGMTANTTFHIDKRDSALRVPNSALRFQPSESLIEPAALKSMQERMQEWSNKGGGKSGSAEDGNGERSRRRMARVWVEAAGDKLKPIRFKPGLADGKWTEVIEGDIAEGQELVIGATQSQTVTSTGPLSGVRRF